MIATLILLLFMGGFITQSSAVTSLYIAAALLIIAELGVASFGLITLNALIALYAAYTLQTGSDIFFGVSLGWGILFSIAFIEITIIGIVVTLYRWLKNKKATTGVESMVGDTATLIDWNGKNGNVRYEGEIWKAHSEKLYDLHPDEKVKIESVHKLHLTISAL